VDTPQGLTTLILARMLKRAASHPETSLETFHEVRRYSVSRYEGLQLPFRLAFHLRHEMDEAGAIRVVAKRPHYAKPRHYRALRIRIRIVPGEQTETATATSNAIGGNDDLHLRPDALRYETCGTAETNETSLPATSTSTALGAIPEMGLLRQDQLIQTLPSLPDRRIAAVA
jgi:hypothetical protein